MIKYIRSFLTWSIWIISGIIVCSICSLLTFLPERIRYTNRVYFFITYYWNKLLLKSTFVKYNILGKENLLNIPSIIIANHTSSLDIPILENLAGIYPHVWVSKVTYLKIPLFGFLIKRMHVAVDKSSLNMAARSIIKVYTLAKSRDTHVLIFPEGARSDGELLPFLQGFIVLAKKFKRPVIPVAIKGANKVLPKGSLVIDTNFNIDIVIGKSFLYTADMTDEQFTSQLEVWFKTVL